MSCLYAYTDYGNYPPFISVNLDTEQNVTITIRGPRKPNGDCGETVDFKMNPRQFREFAERAFGFACTTSA